MPAESIRVTRSVALPPDEIVLRTSRSSGPGGQHANKAETRVEAIFDVELSPSLGELQKRRVIAKVGPIIRAIAQDERSQLRNKELAIERVVDQLRLALHVDPPRVKTRPTKGSVDRRITAKKRRSETKRLRGGSDGE